MAGQKASHAGSPTRAACTSVSVEGEVAAGHSFEAALTPELEFKLEAIASGWIVRVIPAHTPRAAHDYAELATPPYQSVTPLAVSTDFSFRAQDAVAWNPRRFRFAASAAEFAKLNALYASAMRGDAQASGAIATLVATQPEAVLTILDAHLLPGTNDQARMAAAVASHLAATPHSVDAGAASPLGKLTWMKFRVEFTLPAGMRAAAGAHVAPVCSLLP
jgi:hypothetical protein